MIIKEIKNHIKYGTMGFSAQFVSIGKVLDVKPCTLQLSADSKIK